MSKIQNETGRKFENELIEGLKQRGFWCCHLKGVGGTVFDVIAQRKDCVFAAELKTVAKKDYVSYTRELQKKRDEMDRYNNLAENLCIVVKFDNGIYFSEWNVAINSFDETGRLSREEMFNIECIESYYHFDRRGRQLSINA